MHCLIQKALEDKIPANTCNLEAVLYYHLECPDFAKKWDDPRYEKYFKRQMFNLLAAPYMLSRMNELKIMNQPKLVIDMKKKGEFIEYPEEIPVLGQRYVDKIKNDKELRTKFTEGVEFERDSN